MKHHQQKFSNEKRLLIGKEKRSLDYFYSIIVSSTSFYFLTVSVALVLFFIVWAVMQETGDKTPWITSGLFSSLVLFSAVVLREVILRNTIKKYSNANKFAIKASNRSNNSINTNEFSIKKNAALLKRLESKSKEARDSGNLSGKHLEVFELCEDYLKLSYKELKKTKLGSTKWGAIKNGRKRIKKVHRHHLISWAAIESRRLTNEAKKQGSIAGKIETAQKANLVLESALNFYPEDKQLMESIDAVSDFVSSIKISHWIELGEKSAFKGNYNRAISHYKDALFYLARESITNINKELVAENINKEIKKLRKLKSKN